MMAVTEPDVEQETNQVVVTPADPAPLWLPAHDAVVVEQATARPPDRVEGYGLLDRLSTVLLGSPWKMAMTGATTLAVLLFLFTVPGLELGLGSLIKIAFYQAWTLGLVLFVTTRVRSVAAGTLVRSWLAGMFLVSVLSFFLSGPIGSLVEPAEVWIYPLLEFVLMLVPLSVTIIVGRKAWSHPGLADFILLGLAIGGGYGFHAAGLRGETSASGLDTGAGFLIPSMLRTNGLFIVGHAVWAGLLALALGLVLLHRHQALPLAGAISLAFVTVLDRMAVGDAAGTLSWVRRLTFDGSILPLLFLIGLGAAIFLDYRRLAETAERDHLFPPDTTHSPDAGSDEGDLLKGIRIGRYRRRRNAIHNTVDAASQQWPPLSETNPAPLTEVARLGRAAGIAVGPGTSSSGWTPDPDQAGRFRFAGPYGFTPYGSGDGTGQPDELDEGSSTVTSLSDERAGDHAARLASQTRPADFLQFLGLGLVAVALYALVRLLTAGESTGEIITASLHLSDAATSPGLIVGLIGAITSVVALVGRQPTEFGPGWEVGPGQDPSPIRPRECEA